MLASRALRRVSAALADIPDVVAHDGTSGRDARRRWLRTYNEVHAVEGPMIRVWVDAGLDDDALRNDRAAAFDWGRRRMVRFLRGREFGDVDAEAVVMLALVETFGARPRTSVEVDAVQHIIEQGLLGRPRST